MNLTYKGLTNGQMRVKQANKVFCGLIAVYPIINRYASLIPMVTLAEMLLLLFFAYTLMERGKNARYKISTALFPFVSYLLFSLFLALCSSRKDAFDLVGSVARLFYIYFMMMILNKNYADEGLLCSYIANVGTIMAAYAALQLFFSRFGIYLSANIPGLKVMGMDAQELTLLKAGYGLQFRPCGLFTEPAALCIYLALALSILLFQENKQKHYIGKAILISFASVFSRSSTGLIVVVFIWCVAFLRIKSMTRARIIKLVIIGSVGLFAGGYIIIRFGIVEYFIERVFGNAGVSLDLSQSTRFNAISHMFDASDTVYGLFLGAGMEEMVTYLPGFSRIFYCLGLCGLILIMLQLIDIYRKGDTLRRGIMVVYVLLNIGTEVLMGCHMLPFMAVMLTRSQRGRTQLLCGKK